MRNFLIVSVFALAVMACGAPTTSTISNNGGGNGGGGSTPFDSSKLVNHVYLGELSSPSNPTDIAYHAFVFVAGGRQIKYGTSMAFANGAAHSKEQALKNMQAMSPTAFTQKGNFVNFSFGGKLAKFRYEYINEKEFKMYRWMNSNDWEPIGTLKLYHKP